MTTSGVQSLKELLFDRKVLIIINKYFKSKSEEWSGLVSYKVWMVFWTGVNLKTGTVGGVDRISGL